MVSATAYWGAREGRLQLSPCDVLCVWGGWECPHTALGPVLRAAMTAGGGGRAGVQCGVGHWGCVCVWEGARMCTGPAGAPLAIRQRVLAGGWGVVMVTEMVTVMVVVVMVVRRCCGARRALPQSEPRGLLHPSARPQGAAQAGGGGQPHGVERAAWRGGLPQAHVIPRSALCCSAPIACCTHTQRPPSKQAVSCNSTGAYVAL